MWTIFFLVSMPDFTFSVWSFWNTLEHASIHFIAINLPDQAKTQLLVVDCVLSLLFVGAVSVVLFESRSL
jgi:hypothetical protein